MRTKTIRCYVDITGMLVSHASVELRKATAAEKRESNRTHEGWFLADVSVLTLKRRGHTDD